MHKQPPLLQQRARELQQSCTAAEQWLWQRVRHRQLLGCKFRRQVPIGHYIVDFVCYTHKLVIEIDGGQHQQQAEYDQMRTAFLESQGYRVLRYWNNEVLLQGTAVLETIVLALNCRVSQREGVGGGRDSSNQRYCQLIRIVR